MLAGQAPTVTKSCSPERHLRWSQVNLKIVHSFIIAVRRQVFGTRKSHMAFEFRGTRAQLNPVASCFSEVLNNN